MYAIETTKLSFTYKNNPILKDIGLAILPGSIYGYLGKNGAGKSTTIKLLLGLLSSPLDTVYHYGLELSSHRNEILSQVGSLVESPSYYGNLSGYDNLIYLKNIYGCSSQNVHDVLEKVNLLPEKDKKVKRYSSGMKQRLGIAMALLNNPSTLILDEPLNGLDPEGFFEIRELILKLKAEGKTILLSSHILSEIQKTCTHVGILNNGILCYQGLLMDLLDSVPVDVRIQSVDVDKIKRLCLDLRIAANIIEQDLISITINKGEQEGFMRNLGNNGIVIIKAESIAKELEEVYLNLTKQ